MPLTSADLRRLIESTTLSPAQLVDWLPSEAVDLIGEPGSLVVLEQLTQRALMTLAHDDGACRFLDGTLRCSIYEARPASCRLYPFDPSFGRRGGLRRLRLLGGTECEFEQDGHNDPHALREADARRWAEHRLYLEQISAWNRLQQHRARLGRRLHGAERFFVFLGVLAPSASLCGGA